jgi:Arc/MetJ-type ribon-helix-helix transcriptional regulator
MRLTVNLDEETNRTLEELVQERNISKSQVVREAISYYEVISRDWDHVKHAALQWYARLLASPEHQIFDVDHVDSLLSAVGEPSEAMIDEWERIGRKHGVEWASQFSDFEQKLRVLEYCNWYSITNISENEYALTTRGPVQAQLMAAFMRGECEELGFDAEFQPVDQKILARDFG